MSDHIDREQAKEVLRRLRCGDLVSVLADVDAGLVDAAHFDAAWERHAAPWWLQMVRKLLRSEGFT